MGKKQEKTKQILVNRDVSTYLNIYFLIFFQLELKQCLDNVTNDVSKSFIQEKKKSCKIRHCLELVVITVHLISTIELDKTLPQTYSYKISPYTYNTVRY